MSSTTIDRIDSSIVAVLPDAVATRRHLHQHPELSHHEEKTSALVAAKLYALGFDMVKTGVGGYGVVGELHGGASSDNNAVIALRADMDALPIHEENDIPYRSSQSGVMHACGHDGHTATLLGAAAVLASLRDQLTGSVRFIFQPAEETVGGASAMCAEGAMDNVNAIVALHGWPGMDIGKIGVRAGPMMASSDTFDLTIKGRGAHAAMPQISIDPIVVGAQIVLALQTLSSREIAPVDPVVVTVAQFNAGTAHNIIPASAHLKGTVRCLSSPIRQSMPDRIERIIGGICGAMRAEYKFEYRSGTPVTMNDAHINNLITDVGRNYLGPDNVVTLEHPSMGAEDFAYYLERAPGAMFRLGVGADMSPLHTPYYNFADDAVRVGIEMFVRVVLRFLSANPASNS